MAGFRSNTDELIAWTMEEFAQPRQVAIILVLQAARHVDWDHATNAGTLKAAEDGDTEEIKKTLTDWHQGARPE